MTAVKLSMLSKLQEKVPKNSRMRPIPKFGEWKESDPSSAESFSAIFEERRREKLRGHSLSSTRSEPKKKKRSDFRIKSFIKALKKKLSVQRKRLGQWLPLSA